MKRTKSAPVSRRTHSLGGCKTCRLRHVKCDRVRPVCTRCKISGKQCEVSTARLQWILLTAGAQSDIDAPEQDGLQAPQSRQLLESEQSRVAMSEALVARIPGTVDAALNDLDERSQAAAYSSIAAGPFNVLNLNSDEVPMTEDAVAASFSKTRPQSTVDQHELLGDRVVSHITEERAVLPAKNELATSDFLQFSDLFNWDIGPSNQMSDDFFFGKAICTNGWTWQLTDPVLPSSLDIGAAPAALGLSEMESPPLLSKPIDLLTDAPVLLKHFDEHVIHQMSSLPVAEKSPWRIINIPEALLTLTRLTFYPTDITEIRHACLSNFYGLLAVSAYQLSLFPHETNDLQRPEGHWDNLYQLAYRTAKHHLDLSLEKETQGTRKAKYKEQFMAMNATLSTAFISNNEADVSYYLLQLEKIIRFRGLAKRVISRRARLLHHIYAWVRIVSESTRMHDEKQPEAPASPREDISMHLREINTGKPTWSNTNPMGPPSAVPNITLDDFFRLEPRPLHKIPSSGRQVRDVHLIDAGEDVDNTYKQVYGIPEVWLRLLSQTTRLANVLDRATQPGNNESSEALDALQLRAARLEHAICNLTVASEDTSLSAGTNFTEMPRTAEEITPHSCMLRALSSALAIYFYRRVRHVNPMILRSTIDDVLHALRGFEQALVDNKIKSPGTAWPAFIAGCESTSQRQRSEILAWVDKAIRKSGLQNHVAAKKIMVEVWRRRDSATIPQGREGPGPLGAIPHLATWMDVCRETHVWPILC